MISALDPFQQAESYPEAVSFLALVPEFSGTMTQSSAREQEDRPSISQLGDANPGTREASLSTHKGSRKRTKTGCLTCRKRRIKCGEEKPICSNCTKSKRYCEGYNPRRAFPQPMSGPGQRHDPVNVRSGLPPPYFEGYPPAPPCPPPGGSSQTFRPIAPSPSPNARKYSVGGDQTLLAPGLVNGNYWADRSSLLSSAESSEILRFDPHGLYEEGASRYISGMTQHHASIAGHDPGYQRWAGAFNDGRLHDRPSLARSAISTSFVPSSSVSSAQIFGGACSSLALSRNAPAAQSSSSPYNDTFLTPTQIAASGGQPFPPDHPFYSEVTTHLHDPIFETGFDGHDPKRYSSQGFVQRPSFPTSIESPPPVPASQIPYEDDEDEDEDDPWDVEMDSEDDIVQPSEQSQTDLNNMLITHASQKAIGGTRSFTEFLNHKNILASYRPSHSALPQADEKAARIFCHFVSSTGPSLTIFERSSTPQLRARITASSSFHQPLWTYTLPSLALQHPPLMHAMLALSALHISKLQQTSPEPSIKHFTYALRRVGRLIGLPKRRNEVTTLAANLLLGFYEVMSAETSKWNIHLTGARVLVMEIDFAGKTRKIRSMRAQARLQPARLDLENDCGHDRHGGLPESLLSDQDWEVDEQLVSALTGYDVQYDIQYQTNINQAVHQNLNFTAKDIELYKMQADLYWWYCKQDIFQSMISGDRLLMHYDHWVYCPPRGQIGHLDRIYATMDHLCLIMARLADFGGKDQVRKRRVMAGQSAQPSKSTPNPLGPRGNPSIGQGPPLGYMPEPENPAPMHSAFVTMSANLYRSGFPQQSFPTTTETDDLDAETAAALTEHADISRVLDIFAQSLPKEYDPLPPDAAPPINTPFGPALQYRTYTISCIWAFYYAGRIVLHRVHPSMPPAAMISAQVAAAQTAPYAQTIGKICAGLYCPQQYNLQTGTLNPSLGGALAESHFSLFFAAIQFQDQVQRAWTINKLKEIARLSGWQTAAAVAAGCEFAWKATGDAGRGPPYRPTMDWRSKDDRVGDKELKSRDKAEKAQRREMEKQQRERERAEEKEEEEEEEEWKRMRKDKEREERYFVAAGKHGPSRKMTSTNRNKENSEGGEEEDTVPEAITHDRDTIGTNPYARTHWAMGLLSLEDDIAKIDLGRGS